MAAPDLSPLVSALNFGGVTIAILSVAAAIASLAVTAFGIFQIYSMVTGKVFYAGRFWDAKLYDDVMSDVDIYIRRGDFVDAQTRARHLKYTDLDAFRDKKNKSRRRRY
jgi:hypothetical protein